MNKQELNKSLQQIMDLSQAEDIRDLDNIAKKLKEQDIPFSYDPSIEEITLFDEWK